MAFPHIRTFDDLSHAIRGKDEIKVNKRGWFMSVDYMVQMTNTFDSELARECRGIKFYKDGRIAARPFHKFFNRGERPEAEPQSDDYRAEEKLDGSMIHGILGPGGDVFFMTKAGFSDVAMEATNFAQKNLTGEQWREIATELRMGITPMFEYIGPENRIVLKYDEEKLVYLTSRHNVTGEYVVRSIMEDLFEMPTVYDLSDINSVHEWVGHEGVVLVWDDGERLKIKADDYVLKHKTKDNLSEEKNVLALIVDDQVDDLADILDHDDYVRVCEYESAVCKHIIRVALHINHCLENWKNLDRATIAKEYAPKEFSKPELSVFWRCYSHGGSPIEVIKDHIASKLSRQRSVDENRKLIGARWDDYKMKEVKE